MSLFAGLPVPQLTNPDEMALRSRQLMVQAITQGMALGQRKREHKDEMQERRDYRESQAIAVAQVQARKQAKMEAFGQAVTGLKTEKEFLNWSSENVGVALDPDTSPGYQAIAKMFQNKGRIESGASSAKAKVTETHFINRFNDDLEILSNENPEAFAAISLKRPNPNTMPDMEMVGVVAKAKQSLLQKQAAEKQALADKTRRQPASIQLTDEILSSEQKANEAEAQGDTKTATQLRDRATLLREQTKGQEVVTGYDDQGRPIIRMGKGVGAATVGTQSQAQQKLLRYENTVELLNHLSSALKPEHVGAAGVAGEFILDRGLSQLVPELANKDRVDARATLIAAREGLMREVSNDSRFSNIDREEISKALPSTGVFESLPSAQQKMETVRNLITNRGKVYAKGLGEKAPLWTLTADEIKAQYKEFQDSGGKNGIDKETAVRALVRFH